MSETESNSRQILSTKKNDLLQSIRNAVDSLDLNLDVELIHLRIKRAHKCPPGYEAVFEPVENPDGSVTYQWVCKKL